MMNNFKIIFTKEEITIKKKRIQKSIRMKQNEKAKMKPKTKKPIKKKRNQIQNKENNEKK